MPDSYAQRVKRRQATFVVRCIIVFGFHLLNKAKVCDHIQAFLALQRLARV